MTTPATAAPVARRAPVQARSRQTVNRILDAAAAITDEQGVEAAFDRLVDATPGADLMAIMWSSPGKGPRRGHGRTR